MKTQDKTQPDQLGQQEQVSALMDGYLSGPEFDAAMKSVSSDEGGDCWHLYHVIGDVLRSSELASCQRDARFVASLSERLKQEPTRPSEAVPMTIVMPISVVGQSAQQAANDGVFRWKLVAGFASFAAVAAIGWGALGSLGPQTAGPQLAQNTPPAVSRSGGTAPLAVVALPRTAESESPQTMLRDPRLDELLLEHRQASGASALRDASGFLRNATFEGSGR